jgi:hypothetical protein
MREMPGAGQHRTLPKPGRARPTPPGPGPGRLLAQRRSRDSDQRGYRLVPHSRRARVILIGDEIFTKVGGYVLGNFLTSVIRRLDSA